MWIKFDENICIVLIFGVYLHYKQLNETTMITIEAKTKNVYGNEMIYIIDPIQAEAVAVLTGKKTINQMDINALFALGFIIIINN